jgi:hypothetical protein
MNRPNYFNVIEERLNILAQRIISRGRLNILDFHGHSEYFYQFFLNEVYKWEVANENDVKQNVEAIDLVDHTNKLVLQVSATSSKQKIESSLSKDSIKLHIHTKSKEYNDSGSDGLVGYCSNQYILLSLSVILSHLLPGSNIHIPI